MSAWLRVCGLLAIGSLAVAWVTGTAGDAAGHALGWQAQNWASRPWTLWTSAWVHGSAGSLAGHLLALAAVAVIGAWQRLTTPAAAALCGAWPLAILGLLVWPSVGSYGGLGAAVHAAAMVLWAELALREDAKGLSFALFAGMGLKLAAEHAWQQPVAFDPDWGVNAVPAAHLSGAAAGALCGLAAALWRRRPSRPATARPD